MAGTVTLQQLKDPTILLADAKQTPIYIGRALSKQNVLLTRSPSNWVDIPEAESGTTFVPDLLSGTIRYWKTFAEAKYNWSSPDRTSIILTEQNYSYDSTLVDLTKCTAFFVQDGELIYSDPIIDLDIFMHNEIAYPLEFRMLTPFPESLIPQLTNIGNRVEIFLAQIVDTKEFDFEIFGNQIKVLNFIDQLQVSGLNPFVTINLDFLYKINDYRHYILTSQDDLPISSMISNLNPLGIAAHLHRNVSNKPMVLFTIPEDTLEAIQIALEQLEVNTSRYGYSIIPLFYDRAVNNTISAFCTSLQNNLSGYMICYLNEKIAESKQLITANAEAHF